MTMHTITTHVLDVTRGRPAANVSVELRQRVNGQFQLIARGSTNADGRIVDWLPSEKYTKGTYQIGFDTASYFAAIDCADYFFPEVNICFEVKDTERHTHVPLLISPFGYSTYRGS